MSLLVWLASTGLLLTLLWPSVDSDATSWGLSSRLLDAARAPGQTRLRTRRLDEEVPATLDLICLAIGAGATVAAALRTVALRGPQHTAAHATKLVAELDAGLSLDAVLRRIPNSIAPAYQPAVDTLRTTLTHGSPVGELILRLGDEARASRQRQLEKRARQLPVLLLFPLVACSLPALIVGAVVPLVVVSL